MNPLIEIAAILGGLMLLYMFAYTQGSQDTVKAYQNEKNYEPLRREDVEEFELN